MGLSLVLGPAHAGKVALLLERYLAVLGREPWLVVPNRGDVERVERDLIRRSGALLAGRIGTFDDLFAQIASGSGTAELAVASEPQRVLAVKRAIAGVDLAALGASAPTPGFADALLTVVGELESGLVDPEHIGGELGLLVQAYRRELAAFGLRDRDGVRRAAVDTIWAQLDAWHGEPVFAYGFEDLTAAEWALLETLAGRTDVTVSIPYEPARAAFAALERTVDDLSRLANGRIEELPRPDATAFPAALRHLERYVFADEVEHGPSLDGALRFLEGAGTRGTVELLAGEVLAILRGGAGAERVGIVCDSPERWRGALDVVFASFGIPFAIENGVRLVETAQQLDKRGLTGAVFTYDREGCACLDRQVEISKDDPTRFRICERDVFETDCAGWQTCRIACPRQLHA